MSKVLKSSGYILSEELATVVYLFQKLEKPLLLEGEPGVGKTTVASALSDSSGMELIRLQCYEGLDTNSALYEWNYQKQLLQIRLAETNGQTADLSSKLFGDEFLLKRPLLESITRKQRVVLLIDEIDRADEEFEAFLLELLSDFQISIPEMGTMKAVQKTLRYPDIKQNQRTKRRPEKKMPLSLVRLSLRREGSTDHSQKSSPSRGESFARAR